MEKGADYRITKLEKGPLQRFKNQNLLIKKFGESGVAVYKAITGKRTSRELLKDMETDEDKLYEIISFMEENGMVELENVGGQAPKEEAAQEQKAPETPKDEITPEARKEPEIEMEAPEAEKQEEPEIQRPAEQEKIEPEEKPAPETEVREEIKPAAQEAAKPEEDFEIKPIEIEEAPEPKSKNEEPEPNESEEAKQVEAESAPSEEPELQAEPDATEGETAQETEEPGAEPSTEELKIEEEQPEVHEEEEAISPVEKIIKDKYGDIGIKVYTLIDGQKTAEEIMKATGISESKLVEILDFMDEEGIIKLEYPGERKKAPPKEEKPLASSETFNPMLEESEQAEKEIFGKNPIEVPIKTPLNMVESLYLRTKTLLKFGENGGKILESINGKRDVLELSLFNNTPLYETLSVVNFLLDKKGIMMKPLTRTEIRKKYGDDGYSIYKKYGKEGVFLYELVGKDMKIKDMAKQLYSDISANKEKMADMFLFIHQILKIDVPVDRELLYREFEGA